MASQPVEMINGTARTVRELFTGRKYGLDYYQREFDWSESNVTELIDDLTTRFLDSYDPDHQRKHVAGYRPYFLGPIVTNSREGLWYLVDGQQRLTTLTLLLIHLHHLQVDVPTATDVGPLVFSQAYGQATFNIDIEERAKCMDAILNDLDYDTTNTSDSVRNIWHRYLDIQNLFPDELKDDKLPFFVDWLLERVMLVEIATTDPDMGLEIFETMNDRGLRLSMTDMLKSYLLPRIVDEEDIHTANETWRTRIQELVDVDRNADSDFIKSWLRAKHAETIRERKKDATPGDFDLIGTSFHKWTRDNREKIGLRAPLDFRAFVDRDFQTLSRRYLTLSQASQTFTPGLEHLYYNAQNGFTWQLTLALAPVTPVDSDELFQAKVDLVTKFVDLFVVRRMVNYRNYGYSTVSYTMFNLAKDIRDLDLDELAKVLADRVADLEEDMDAVERFALNQINGSRIKYLLSRMTAWVNEQCSESPDFPTYYDNSIGKPYEIEHIWANKPERFLDEFPAVHDFDEHRNRFGGLVLLPKDFNASYGALPYEDKLDHYYSQNLLARSLHPKTYHHNPTFLRFIQETGLPFVPHTQFKKADQESRQHLYRLICERIWDPTALGLGGGTPSVSDSTGTKVPYYGIRLTDLIASTLLKADEPLLGKARNHTFSAELTADGQIRTPDGNLFDTPSAAAMHVLERDSWNGWDWWTVTRSGTQVKLSRVREDYLSVTGGKL
jgi:hypothetical protein